MVYNRTVGNSPNSDLVEYDYLRFASSAWSLINIVFLEAFEMGASDWPTAVVGTPVALYKGEEQILGPGFNQFWSVFFSSHQCKILNYKINLERKPP